MFSIEYIDENDKLAYFYSHTHKTKQLKQPNTSHLVTTPGREHGVFSVDRQVRYLFFVTTESDK